MDAAHSQSSEIGKFLALLARASEELGSSLDFACTVERVGAIAVPLLADWSILYLLQDAELLLAQVFHRHSQAGEDLKSFFGDPENQGRLHLVSAIQSGEPQLCRMSFGEESEVLTLPLRQGADIIGVLCLGLEPGRKFQAEDTLLAQELAQRAASAIENALLYNRALTAEAELREAKKAAERANTAKTEFLANMSHEIRTPLSAILGFVDLLFLPDQSDEERFEWARRVKTNSQHLQRLIDDILNLSKVESGKMEIREEEFCFSSFMRDLEASFAGAASTKGLKLKTRFASPVPSRLRTDSTRLHQILANLLGNAIKFTDEGSVKLTVFFEAEGGRLCFDVADTGPGLTEAQAARLFHPFMQADAAHTRRHGGTGLGLALAKKLAQLLSGDVELLASAQGQGACFRVSIRPEIPAATPLLTLFPRSKDSLSGATEVSEDHGGSLAGARILLVDDSSHN